MPEIDPQDELSFSWTELTTPPVEYEFGYKLGHFELVHQPVVERTIYDFDLSEMIIKMAINSAIYLKQTSIPAKLTDLTEQTVRVGSVMEEHLQLKRKIKIVGHAFVSAIVNVCTTFIAAILQFIIAYHNAPGQIRNDRPEIETEKRIIRNLANHSELVTFCVGGQSFTTQMKWIVKNQDTTLARLVLTRDNTEETVFIDRDGTHFRHILNHFRGSDTVMNIRDGQVLADLLEECYYYGLKEMITLIMARQAELADMFHEEKQRSRSRGRSKSRTDSRSITRYENASSSDDDLDTLKPVDPKRFSLY